MKPLLLRTAGFLLTISPATLAAAVALTAGRRVVSLVPPAVVVSLVLVATASLFSGSVDWTLLVGIASVGLVLAGARSRPGLTLDQAKTVWQGAVSGLYLLALLAALQVSPLARPLFQGLDALVEPVLGRFGLGLSLWPLELPGRASLWTLHPNLLGASVLVPALAAMALRRSMLTRLVVVVPSLGLLALTGSRSALLGLAVGILVQLVYDAVAGRSVTPSTVGDRAAEPVRGVPPRGRVLVSALVLVIFALLLLLLVPGLRGRVMPRGGAFGTTGDRSTASAGATAAVATNLLLSSEDLSDGVWWRPFVTVERADGEGPAGQVEDSAWSLRRTGGGPVDRIQQRVMLDVGERYVFSFEYLPSGGTPGVVAWGTGGPEPYGFEVRESEDVGAPDAWSGTRTGDVTIETLDVEDRADGWRRVAVTFRLSNGPARPVEIGIAPDMRRLVPTEPVVVRAPMLQAGPTSRQYSPTYPPDRGALRAASAVDTRLRVYDHVVERFAQRPLVGWGPDGFTLLRSDSHDAVVRATAHEHSLLLWAALRYGLLGVVAVLVLVLCLYRHRPEQVAAVVGVMVANLFDLTFWSSGVVLSLALVVGTSLDKGTAREDGR